VAIHYTFAPLDLRLPGRFSVPHRRQARTIAFQILYSIVYSRLDVDEAAHVMLGERHPLPPFGLTARVVPKPGYWTADRASGALASGAVAAS
jgi:hypothetical protein